MRLLRHLPFTLLFLFLSSKLCLGQQNVSTKVGIGLSKLNSTKKINHSDGFNLLLRPLLQINNHAWVGFNVTYHHFSKDYSSREESLSITEAHPTIYISKEFDQYGPKGFFAEVNAGLTMLRYKTRNKSGLNWKTDHSGDNSFGFGLAGGYALRTFTQNNMEFSFHLKTMGKNSSKINLITVIHFGVTF